MQKIVLSILVIAILVISGCKHDHVNPSPSTWTYNATTYQGSRTFFSSTSLISVDTSMSIDPTATTIAVTFYSKPVINGTYTVVGNGLSSSTQCSIAVGNGSTSVFYNSTGAPGDVAAVTVSGGKVTVVFSGISIADATSIKLVSGTIIEQ